MGEPAGRAGRRKAGHGGQARGPRGRSSKSAPPGWVSRAPGAPACCSSPTTGCSNCGRVAGCTASSGTVLWPPGTGAVCLRRRQALLRPRRPPRPRSSAPSSPLPPATRRSRPRSTPRRHRPARLRTRSPRPCGRRRSTSSAASSAGAKCRAGSTRSCRSASSKTATLRRFSSPASTPASRSTWRTTWARKFSPRYPNTPRMVGSWRGCGGNGGRPSETFGVP